MNWLPLVWPKVARPLIGVVHLPALPGAPRYGGDWQAIVTQAIRDAEALALGGAAGVMIENFGDAPFYPGRVPAHVVASMTAIASEVRRRVDLPLGMNVLRNDGRGALAVAQAVGASFIRVNVLSGARLTDQGIVQGIAHDLLRDRSALGATDIRILADVDVKHSVPLGPQPIAEAAVELVERAGADALIVTGAATGQAVQWEHLRQVAEATSETPIFVGSGVTEQRLTELAALCHGFIVGTALKDPVTGRIDQRRVSDLVRLLEEKIEPV
jgi:membrane complex biogenesis BtpA family protein